MVTIKCIKPIKDISIGRLRTANEVFTTTPERAVEMQNGLGVKFKDYFVVQKVAKVQTKTTKKPTVKKADKDKK